MSTSSGEVGELSNESFYVREAVRKVVWKIPDFFSLPKAKNYSVESPSFSLANATWRLKMFPNGRESDEEVGYVHVAIVRLQSLVSEHAVFYKIFIPTLTGTEFESYRTCSDFNEEHPYWAVDYFVSYCELETQRYFFSFNGTLTIICEMRILKMSVTEAHSQMDLSETLGSNEDKVESPTAVHVNKLSQNFQELLYSGEDSDVTIQVKGREFRAHKPILKARSSVFASMFRNEMKEKATGVVEVEDCDPDTFLDFLHYLYGGRVDKLSDQNVFSLYATANKYDVQDLKSECLKFIMNNLSVDNFIDTIRLCLRYSEVELLKLASDFFAKIFQKAVKWEVFLAENITYGNELPVKALVPDNQNNQ